MKKINEDLADSEARFRMLVKQAPMAITILKGEEYIVDLANDVILKKWGKTDSILNKKIVDALPGNQHESFLPLLREVYMTGIPYVGHEVKNVFLYEGIPKEVFLNFSYQALKDRTGKTGSIMVISTEVTKQVEARKKLQNAIRMLKFSLEQQILEPGCTIQKQGLSLFPAVLKYYLVSGMMKMSAFLD